MEKTLDSGVCLTYRADAGLEPWASVDVFFTPFEPDTLFGLTDPEDEIMELLDGDNYTHLASLVKLAAFLDDDHDVLHAVSQIAEAAFSAGVAFADSGKDLRWLERRCEKSQQ